MPSGNKPGKLRTRCGTLEQKTPNNTPRASIFAEFETVQLTSEERIYLNAARQGDPGMLAQILDSPETRLNTNCVDYMGRNALHLAIDSDSLDTIEVLMEKVNQECIEEALLHAINKGDVTIVRCMIDHPRYMAVEKVEKLTGRKDAFFRTEETYQFPPDITPLILAAHKNNHEIIQLFLSRGHTVERPHAIHCACEDCQMKQSCDSLKRSRSRLNAYKALASPAYMALSSPDPITTTFELRQEMMKVGEVEKEFKNEYLGLVEQCMNFACELMDLCRGTQEVEAMLSEETSQIRDPLARLKMAIKYSEKKFVAHPNCQQHLTNIWYGKEMGFMQGASFMRQFAYITLLLPALPFLCIAYIVSPRSKLGSILRCPISKFITHTTSHFFFLTLLAAATFNFETVVGKDKLHSTFNITWLFENHNRINSILRPGQVTFTAVQWLIMCWVLGLLWIECKQIYYSGAREHFRQFYNYMDLSILALYISSYTLRYVAQMLVSRADKAFGGGYDRARKALQNNDTSALEKLESEFNSGRQHSYFMMASRFEWANNDPQIISEILFAVANVMSFARTTFIMPAHELLGPLQISLGRMLGDITRFIVLLVIVLLAFMVGLTNLYSYYGSHINTYTRLPASEPFRGLPETVHTLFFSIFGLISLDKLRIDNPHEKELKQKSYLVLPDSSTYMVDRVGLLMFALYQVVVSIVLVNILIAMMSHSFEAIQGDNDVEWKFARTKLWMNYIEEGGTLPVPFNVVPTPKTVKYAMKYLRNLCKVDDEPVQYDFTRRRQNILLPDASAIPLMKHQTTFSDIVQRLVRRYLFKMERDRMDLDASSNVRSEEYLEEEPAEADLPSPRGSVQEKARSPKHVFINLPPEADMPDDGGFTRQPSRRLIRRSTKKRGPIGGAIMRPSDPTLEAIQRGQRMLDARLQELQTVNTGEGEVRQNVTYIKQVLIKQNQATDQILDALANMKNEISKTEVLRTHQTITTSQTKTKLKPPRRGSKKGRPGSNDEAHV